MEKIKVTNKLMQILKVYARLLSRAEERYVGEICGLEKMMQTETGIEDIEFFFCDGEFVGIGTPACPEKMKLIHRNRLEK